MQWKFVFPNKKIIKKINKNERLQIRKMNAASTEKHFVRFCFEFLWACWWNCWRWCLAVDLKTTNPWKIRLKIASKNPWLLTGRRPWEDMKTVWPLRQWEWRAITSEEEHKSTDTRSSNQSQEANCVKCNYILSAFHNPLQEAQRERTECLFHLWN